MSDPHAPAPRAPLLPRVLIVLVTLWALLGYLIVPWLVHAVAPRLAADALDAQLDIGDVYFDPFALRLRLHEIVLRGPLEAPGFEPEPLVHIGLLDLNLSALSLLTLSPALEAALDAPDLRVELDEDGALNLAALLPQAPDDVAEDESADETAPLPDLILSLSIHDGRVAIIDRSRPQRFETRVTGIGLTLEALELRPGAASPIDISAELEGAQLHLSGELDTRPNARIALQLANFPLALVDRWLADTTPARDLSGRLDLDAKLAFADGALRLDDGKLTLRDLSVSSDAPVQAQFDLERLALRGVAGDLLQPDLAIAALELHGPHLAAIHERDTLAALTAFIGASAGPTGSVTRESGTMTSDSPRGNDGRPASADSTADTEDRDGDGAVGAEVGGAAARDGTGAGADPSAPRITLDALRVQDLALSLTDRTIDGAPTVTLDRGAIELGRIVPVGGTGDEAATPLQVDLRALGSGRLTFDGAVRLAPRVDGRLELADLDLAALAPWAQHHAQLGLKTATLGLDMDVELTASAVLDATLRLADVELEDPDGVRLLAFGLLEVDGVRLDGGVRDASIETITLERPAARFARLTDGSTNLDGLGTPADAPDQPEAAEAEPATAPGDPSDAADAQTESVPESEAAEGDAPQAAPWTWSVGRVSVAGGSLNFIDETLVIPFGTAVEAIGAALNDISSTADAPARIVLDGRVPPNGSMRVETTLALFAPLDDAVIDVRFRQVPMPQLSPYTGTFAGRSIAGGRLDLDLAYRLDGGRLSAKNRIVATALRLGPRVDSPSAMDLPLELALALLRDSDDRIVLEVPVTGDVDDPSFDITPVIMRAIGNVIRGIVTAPFRLLGSLLGSGGDETLDRVAFPLGSAIIPASEAERFVSLETALNQRPSLLLVLDPTRAPQADRDALRIAALDARIRAIAAPDGARGGSGAVSLEQASAPTWNTEAGAGTGPEVDEAALNAALRTLFARDYGEDALAAIVTQYDQGDASSNSSATALAGELRGRLLADTRLPEGALETLARDRALAVRDQLAAVGLDPARIRIRETLVEGETRDDDAVIMKFDLAPGPEA